MPTASELRKIYAAAYAEPNIVENFADQLSDIFACRKYLQLIRALSVAPPMRILDYGAGTGLLVELLKGSGFLADGFEYSGEARSHCQRARGFALAGPGDELPRGAYSLVTMIEVIEHLTDLWGTLSQLQQCLAPGGRLLIATPNLHGFRALCAGGNWREARKKYHLMLFKWRTLRLHLIANGFENVQRQWFPPIVVRGAARQFYGRSIQLLGLAGTLCVVATKSVEVVENLGEGLV